MDIKYWPKTARLRDNVKVNKLMEPGLPFMTRLSELSSRMEKGLLVISDIISKIQSVTILYKMEQLDSEE